MNRLRFGLLAFVALVMIWACGGGGSSSSATRSIQAFATDDLNTGYDHVWVKIKRIELSTGTSTSTVFDETTSGGVVVDLHRLHDSTGGRYLLLSAVGIADGSYTAASITVDKDVSIVTTGASTATAATFAGSGATDKVLTYTFPTAFNPATSPRLVIDFNLQDWVLSGGIVSATGEGYVKHAEANDIGDESRHEASEYSGTVSNLAGTAPTQTFTITRRGRSMNVSTGVTTTIFNNDGSANPTLTNGQKVEVTGTFDTASNILNASKVKIEKETESEGEAQFSGLVTAFDATAGTLTATIGRAHEFTPTGTSVNVTTNSATRYFGHSGIEMTKDEFFAALTAGVTGLEAEGTTSDGTSLLAKRLKLETESGEGGDDHGGSTGGGSTGGGSTSGGGSTGGGTGGGGGDDSGHRHEVEFKGVVSNLNSEAKTFDLTVQQFVGVSIPAGTKVPVTNVGVTLPDGLANGSRVEVKGIFDLTAMTLTSSRVKLDD